MAIIKSKKDRKDIKIRIKSHDHRLIDESVSMVIESAKGTGATVTGPIPVKNKIFKITVLRSPIRHSKAREQYKLCIHSRLLYIKFATPNTIDALKDLSLPDGIDISLNQI
ncbi:MAG: 30S ribosomal protein S10 [Chlamydiia bacterium]|nr:30S ribosomal protein S10 [Chlamydiia bacterium]